MSESLSDPGIPNTIVITGNHPNPIISDDEKKNKTEKQKHLDKIRAFSQLAINDGVQIPEFSETGGKNELLLKDYADNR